MLPKGSTRSTAPQGAVCLCGNVRHFGRAHRRGRAAGAAARPVRAPSRAARRRGEPDPAAAQVRLSRPGNARERAPRRLLLRRCEPRGRPGRLGGLRAGLLLRAADADRARPVTGGSGGVAGLADGRARLLQPLLAPDYTMAAIRKARAVVLEVNPNVPFAYGDCHVHISQVAGTGRERRSPFWKSACPRSARCSRPSASTWPT
jgi:hypothetical protein